MLILSASALRYSADPVSFGACGSNYYGPWRWHLRGSPGIGVLGQSIVSYEAEGLRDGNERAEQTFRKLGTATGADFLEILV